MSPVSDVSFSCCPLPDKLLSSGDVIVGSGSSVMCCTLPVKLLSSGVYSGSQLNSGSGNIFVLFIFLTCSVRCFAVNFVNVGYFSSQRSFSLFMYPNFPGCDVLYNFARSLFIC